MLPASAAIIQAAGEKALTSYLLEQTDDPMGQRINALLDEANRQRGANEPLVFTQEEISRFREAVGGFEG